MKSLKESPVYLLNLFNNVINLFQKDIEDLPICPTKINSDKAIEFSNVIDLIVDEREVNKFESV
jgi:hypothetical protein